MDIEKILLEKDKITICSVTNNASGCYKILFDEKPMIIKILNIQHLSLNNYKLPIYDSCESYRILISVIEEIIKRTLNNENIKIKSKRDYCSPSFLLTKLPKLFDNISFGGETPSEIQENCVKEINKILINEKLNIIMDISTLVFNGKNLEVTQYSIVDFIV